MRVGRTVQPLSYELRLPDAVQAAALRLLDVSREVINATVAALWERLDDFGERETRYAYKQVTALIGSCEPHGDRQWRCEAEQAGRILRGQAGRKQQFALILPLLEQGMILPKTEHTRAGKNRTAIKAALACLRDEDSDGGSAVELQGLIEQACNYYLTHGCFPETYEDMQAVPVLKVGILPYAADDGGEHGQALSVAHRSGGALLLFRVSCPRSDRRSGKPQLDRAADAPSLARSSRGAPPGRRKPRTNVARGRRTRWHALRRPGSHHRGSRHSTA